MSECINKNDYIEKYRHMVKISLPIMMCIIMTVIAMVIPEYIRLFFNVGLMLTIWFYISSKKIEDNVLSDIFEKNAEKSLEKLSNKIVSIKKKYDNALPTNVELRTALHDMEELRYVLENNENVLMLTKEFFTTIDYHIYNIWAHSYQEKDNENGIASFACMKMKMEEIFKTLEEMNILEGENKEEVHKRIERKERVRREENQFFDQFKLRREHWHLTMLVSYLLITAFIIIGCDTVEERMIWMFWNFNICYILDACIKPINNMIIERHHHEYIQYLLNHDS